MGFWSQLGLILWKNVTIQRRNWIWTVFQVIVPIIFSCVMVILRSIVTENDHDALIYPSFPVTGNLKEDGGDGLSNDTFFNLKLCYFPSRLAYAPKTDLTDRIMKRARDRMGNGTISFPNQQHIPHRFLEYNFTANVTGYKTEADLVEFLSNYFVNHSGASPLPNGCDVLRNADTGQFNYYFGGIVFNESFARGNLGTAAYYIRFSNSPRNHLNTGSKQPLMFDNSWATTKSFSVETSGPRAPYDLHGGWPGYWQEGFLTIQRVIDYAIISEFANFTAEEQAEFDKLDLSLRRYPYPSYKNNPFVAVVQNYFPLILMISYCVSVLYVARNIVLEKEYRLKEYMKIMGLKGYIHWTAHFITNFVLLAIVAAVTTILLTSSFNGKQFITKADPSIIFVFLLIFSAAAICFAFAVSVCFKKGSAAAGCSFIIWFICYIPFVFLQKRYGMMTFAQKISACLFMPCAMAFGAYVVGIFEATGAGAQWHNINIPGTPDDNFTFAHSWGMMILDAVICILITWYGDNVNPGDEGVPKPWYFPVTLSYWFPRRSRKIHTSTDKLPTERFQPCADFDVEPSDRTAEVIIYNLTKGFGRGKKAKIAVDGLSLRMYYGQITALLGHNGAGKSTTLAMLTGLLPPTDGFAVIHGFDVSLQMEQIRKYLGFCPQYNVLFDKLTVDEHLEFFCKLKDRPFDKAEADRLLSSISLTKKRNELSMNLSGGMKRKLSMIISLIGGSEIVLLDEPTSGMDPGARHETWKLLQAEKGSRTILLTTHYMEEADLLGDRIAILAKGDLQCCGSSLFLKNRYGAGYHVTCVFNRKEIGLDEKADLSLPSYHVDDMLAIIRAHCKSARLDSSIGAEANFILPYEDKHKFERLFSDLESRQQKLNISSFGVSLTTMEEVFLRVSKEVTDRKREEKQDAAAISTEGIPLKERFLFTSPITNVGWRLKAQQFYAMFLKRLLLNFRNGLILFAQLAIPIIFMLLALLVNKMLPGATNQPPLQFNLDPFEVNSNPTIYAAYADSSKAADLPLLNQYTSMIPDDYVQVRNYRNEDAFIDFLIKRPSEVGMTTFNLHYPISSWFDNSTEITPVNADGIGDPLVAFFNDQPIHTPAIALSYLDNALLRYYVNQSHVNVPNRIVTYNHPLPATSVDKLNDWLASGAKEFTLAMFLVFGMSFCASGFVVFLVRERVTKAKHLQFLSGIDAAAFWISALIWDMICYMIPVSVILILFRLFNVGYLIDYPSWGHMLVFLILYGWAVIPQTYCASFLFSESTGGFVKMVIFNLVSGLVPLIVVSILYLLVENTAAKVCEWVFFAFFPNFCLGQGIDIYYMNRYLTEQCQEVDLVPGNLKCNQFLENGVKSVGWCCEAGGYNPNFVAWPHPGIGREYFFLSIQGIGYLILLFLLELGYVRRAIYFLRSYKPERRRHYALLHDDAILEQAMGMDSLMDEDVKAERDLVTKLSRGWSVGSLYSLLVSKLSKSYGKKRAVDQLSFTVKPTDCFGLLGINGAGKTSTFEMLTGANQVSGGDASVVGYSIRSDWKEAGRHVGYCPQFDALIDLLTGREALSLFARLRGIPEKRIPAIVSNVTSALGLTEFEDRYIRNYSGGMKRKLSLGAALVGEPPLLLLDEPTSGVDPSTRRFVWKILTQIRERGIAMLLSSHSMEECEALCTRIAIMASGSLKCIGSTQHLKSKFGNAYTVLIKVANMDYEGPVMKSFVESFRTCSLQEIHNSYPPVLQFRIPVTDAKWSTLFGNVQRMAARKELGILDYSVSQTTLEQVFLNLTRSESEEGHQTESNSSDC